LDDIDSDKVYQFVEIANSLRSFNENLYLHIDIILSKLNLILDNGQITIADIILFGKNPQKFFEGFYEIKMGDFLDNHGYDDISNDQEYNGTLIDNFQAGLNFILKSIAHATHKEGMTRKERYELPQSVLREALVNMIVHRDYRQQIKSTVEIRPEKIIFYNPAQLFSPSITIDLLKTQHPSKPGNKLIAKIFYLMGFFENWGSGTLKIYEEIEKAGKLEPRFSYQNTMFKLEVFR
jgi:ATP-dependent DNA helicase RecG